MNNYGIDIWGDDNFIIDNGVVKINHASTPALIDIVESVRKDGLTGPLLLRFPHITQTNR